MLELELNSDVMSLKLFRFTSNGTTHYQSSSYYIRIAIAWASKHVQHRPHAPHLHGTDIARFNHTVLYRTAQSLARVRMFWRPQAHSRTDKALWSAPMQNVKFSVNSKATSKFN